MMERLRRLLTTHAPADTDPSRVSIEERIESEELQRARGRHREEVRSAFLEATPRQQAELIQGQVRAWVYGYPARDSYLWLQTAIRAVAAALCAQFFAAALELWMWRPLELDAKLLSSFNEGIEPARAAVRAGIQTVAEAADVTVLVGATCDRIIPSMVWDYVAPKLDWVRAGEVSPDVSVLAAGLAQVDPVCGMSLTSDRVAARLDVEEEPVYFCSLSCRQRYEEMHDEGRNHS
jgi:YHS domain-containing protein